MQDCSRAQAESLTRWKIAPGFADELSGMGAVRVDPDGLMVNLGNEERTPCLPLTQRVTYNTELGQPTSEPGDLSEIWPLSNLVRKQLVRWVTEEVSAKG